MGDRPSPTRSRWVAAALGACLFAASCSSADEATPETASVDEIGPQASDDAPAVTDEAATTDAASGTGTSNDNGDDDETVADGLEPLTASARGVTETELHIGISMLDFGALGELNLVTEGWGDQMAVYQTYVDDLNERGGIHDRTVVPHYELYSPLGSTEAEAACLALTKDVETFVVVGGFLGPAELANDCIVDTNDTILVGGRQTRERLADARAPWADTPALRERRLEVFLDLLDVSGMLEGRKVAIIGSIEQEDIYDVAGDTLGAFGVSPVLEALNDAPQGDTIATDARWAVLSENVRASGADTVLLIGSTQGGVRGVAAGGLDVEVWALEVSGLENLGSETLPSDANGAISITALTDQEQWEDETMAPCIDLFAAAHPEVELKDPNSHVDGDEQWYKSIHLYCRNIALFELLATGAGRNPTQESWQQAMDEAGEFSLPGVPFASLGPGKPDAGDSFQLVRFDEDEGESGGLVSISEILDGTP